MFFLALLMLRWFLIIDILIIIALFKIGKFVLEVLAKIVARFLWDKDPQDSAPLSIF